MDKQDIVAVAVLFMAALYVWSLPFQGNTLPFGEGDSAWHFSVGDYMAQSDRLIWRLPFYVGTWYYGFNQVLGPFALEYTPSNHVDYGLMQIVGGERFVPVFVFRAFASFAGIFATYFLIRRLYGFTPAVLASFGLVFSLREYMIYLWGQQPSLVSFVMVPVFLYALYRYLISFFEGAPKNVYLWMMTLLLISQYLLHIQGMIVTLFTSLFFFLFLLIRYKKLPLSRKTLLHLGAAVAVFAIFAAPFLLIYTGASTEYSDEPRDWSRLLQWNVPHHFVEGSFPPAFVSFTAEYSSMWMVPPILLGVAVLLLRRQNKDLLLLAWVGAIYVTMHLDLIVGGKALLGRVARMGVAEPPVFFSLAAIGLLTLPSLLPLQKAYKTVIRYGIVGVIALVLFSTIGGQAQNTLSSAYQGLGRITPAQYDVAMWMRENLPENALVYTAGTFSYPKARWMLASSHRHVEVFSGKFSNLTRWMPSPYYLMLDLSDIAALSSAAQYRDSALAQAAQLQQVEQQLFASQAPLYDKNNIKVYEVDKAKIFPQQ